jgi:hypothetical protein
MSEKLLADNSISQRNGDAVIPDPPHIKIIISSAVPHK